MNQTQVQVTTARRRRNRDDGLRAAHERAFDKIVRSRWDPDRHEKITRAVEELIDACEQYVNGG